MDVRVERDHLERRLAVGRLVQPQFDRRGVPAVDGEIDAVRIRLRPGG